MPLHEIIVIFFHLKTALVFIKTNLVIFGIFKTNPRIRDQGKRFNIQSRFKFQQGNSFVTRMTTLLSKKLKFICFKRTYGHSVDDYRVATLHKSYLAVIGIIMQSLKSIGQF